MNSEKLREFLTFYLINFLISFLLVGGWTTIIGEFRLDIILIVCAIMSLFVTSLVLGQHEKEERIIEGFERRLVDINEKKAEEGEIEKVDVKEFLNDVEKIAIERLKHYKSSECHAPQDFVEYIQSEMNNVLQAILIINLQRDINIKEKNIGDINEN
jgi:hypothetical protein